MDSLLFDKSAFQSIGINVYPAIRRTYRVVTSRTLLEEIAGDLVEGREFGRATPEQRAASLARRFGTDWDTHQSWEHLAAADLMSDDWTLPREPIVANAVTATTPDGRLFSLSVPLPDGSTVSPRQNWINELARQTWHTRYPAQHRTLEAEVEALWGTLAGRARALGLPAEPPDDEASVVSSADRALSMSGSDDLLRWIVNSIPTRLVPPATFRKRVKRRWIAAGKPPLTSFAPYATHCARVSLLYLVGYQHWPKRRELNDIRDLDYLRLVPFFDVFASDDKLVRAIAKHLLRPDQRLTCSCRLRHEITGEWKDEDRCRRAHGA